jgi:hypothetical protein
MKRTYTGTLFHPDLTTAKVHIYDFGENTKYKSHPDAEEHLVEYTGVTAWDIIEGGEEAAEIEQSGMVDEFHEYLVLHFKDGNTATFMNSHVDMFIL